MGLDIHKLENGKSSELLISLSDSDLTSLRPAFDLFQSKTGIFIDPYSDLKFGSGFMPLIQSLESLNSNHVIYQKLIKILKTAEAKKFSLIFLGD